jgi:hypothetical protein
MKSGLIQFINDCQHAHHLMRSKIGFGVAGFGSFAVKNDHIM